MNGRMGSNSRLERCRGLLHGRRLGVGGCNELGIGEAGEDMMTEAGAERGATESSSVRTCIDGNEYRRR